MEVEMRAIVAGVLSVLMLPVLAGSASAAAVAGQPAPAFAAKDSSGATQSLAANKGKWVILEWNNFECPFVQKHYGTGNMQALQREATDKGVVWFTVNSSAAGKQGHYSADAVASMLKSRNAAPTAYLLDADGTVGRAYGAKTTPHMFIIDKEGKLAYAGGIDDKPNGEPKAPLAEGTTNYVDKALTELQSGTTVSVPETKSYGCSVKYKK
jgi:hypothetical protein